MSLFWPTGYSEGHWCVSWLDGDKIDSYNFSLSLFFQSASAEELKERERHKTLESSYNFRLEDLQTEEFPQDGDENLSSETPSSDSDINDSDVIDDLN